MVDLNRVRTVWTGVPGTPWYTNMYFLTDDTDGAASDQVSAVDQFWTDLSGNIHADADWVVQGEVIQIDETSGAITGARTVPSVPGSGVASGDLLPRATQGLVQWRTTTVVNGRFVRGHTFIPGLVESLNVAGGVPAAAFVTIMQNAGESLIDNVTLPLVIWSKSGGTHGEVTAAAAWSEWASLRSRRD